MRCDWTHIEAQLDVRRGGGICFETAKGQAIRDPVLVIGLGGTGIDAMLRVKDQVLCNLRPGAEDLVENGTRLPGNFAFLGVDTDYAARRRTFGRTNLEESQEDFLHLGVRNLREAVRELWRDAPEWDWLEPGLDVGDGMNGSGAVRQVGRLMLFLNFQKTVDRLNFLLRRIVARAAPHGNCLRIYLLTGLGGGTGSRILLDLAYLLRQLGHSITPNVQTFGFLFTPDLERHHPDYAPTLSCNGFAALKELDYWMSIREPGKRFTQFYPGGFTIDVADQPLDFCCIVPTLDANRDLLPCELRMDRVAEAVCNQLTRRQNEGDDPFGTWDVIFQEWFAHGANAEANAEFPGNYRYTSLGSASLRIPYREIMTLLAGRVAEQLDSIVRWVSDDQSFRQDLEHVHLHHNVPGMLWREIWKDIPDNSLTKGQRISSREIIAEIPPHARMRRWFGEHANRAMAQQGYAALGMIMGDIESYMGSLAAAPHLELPTAGRMLNSIHGTEQLINTMEAYQYACRERVGLCRSKHGIMADRLGRTCEAVRRASPLTRSRSVQEYNDALRAWAENELACLGESEAEKVFSFLLVPLKEWRHVLTSAIPRLVQISRENIQFIRQTDAEIRRDPLRSESCLITASEFEQQHLERIQEETDRAARGFLFQLFRTLWEDAEARKTNNMTEVPDLDLYELLSKEVSGAFRQLISTELSLERLLLERARARESEDDCLRRILRNLRLAAAPAAQMEPREIMLNGFKYALVSIPENNPSLTDEAFNLGISFNEKVQCINDPGKLRWMSVMAGLSLSAFPEVTWMETHYLDGVKSEPIRKGLHLRPEWRETLPSPLPERA